LPGGDDPTLPQSDAGVVIQFLADWMNHPSIDRFSILIAWVALIVLIVLAL
jgi:hypothetical protein